MFDLYGIPIQIFEYLDLYYCHAICQLLNPAKSQFRWHLSYFSISKLPFPSRKSQNRLVRMVLVRPQLKLPIENIHDGGDEAYFVISHFPFKYRKFPNRSRGLYFFFAIFSAACIRERLLNESGFYWANFKIAWIGAFIFGASYGP